MSTKIQKKLKYAPRAKRVTVEDPETALLKQLKKLAASGKTMTLRALRIEHDIDPARIHILAQKRPEEIQISGLPGRDHLVRIGPPAPVVRSPQAVVVAAPPAVVAPPIEALEPEPAAQVVPTKPARQPSPAERAGWPKPVVMSEEEYNALVVTCGGPNRRAGALIGARGARGQGRPMSDRQRTRRPLVDLATGQNLETKYAQEAHVGIRKRYSRKDYQRALDEIRLKEAAAAGPATPAVLGRNPWAKGQENRTRQAELLRTEPEKARRLAREAGKVVSW
jgi:hypothetical protein